MDTAIGKYRSLQLKLKRLERAEPEALERQELLRQELEIVYALMTEHDRAEIDTLV